MWCKLPPCEALGLDVMHAACSSIVLVARKLLWIGFVCVGCDELRRARTAIILTRARAPGTTVYSGPHPTAI
jgi:hypothetical protein